MPGSDTVTAVPAYGITESGLERKEETKSKSERIIQLDFIRGIAILLVIGYHELTVPTSVVAFRVIDFPFRKFGWSGVDLFFVLSGFLVGGLLIGEYAKRGSIRAGRFIKRRGFKIWPAYYFYLLFQIITRHFPLSTFLVPNLLHLQNYLGTSLSHTWTLAVEEHFYLALPFLLIFLTRSRRLQSHIIPVLLGICVATLLLRSWMVIFLGSTRVSQYTHTRIDSLMFGVFLSYLYHCRRPLFDRLMNQTWVLLAITVAGILFLSIASDSSALMRTVGYTINYLSYGSLMLLVLRSTGRWTKSVPYRVIAWIGLYSYSIYLWHVSVRTPLFRLSAHLHGNLQWIALSLSQFVFAVLLGVVMAKLVEWPFLRLRERFVPTAA
jgi:peptidoglycan/LPS O-acetylase OafA/YrhL